MTERAKTLFLVDPPGPVEVSKDTILLGLPLVERTRLAAKRAGFEEVVSSANDGAAVGLALPWNAVVTVRELKSFLEGAPPFFLTLSKKSEIPAAEKHLLRSLIKDEEGFMSRHVERKISLAITRLLVRTSITPNAMTLVSVAIGLVGAACFLVWSRPWHVAGALLFLSHSILDGCDGEIARLKFLESRWGGLLDFWGDNVVHAAVFTGIGIGWSRAGGGWPPLALAALSQGANRTGTRRFAKRGRGRRRCAACGRRRTTEPRNGLSVRFCSNSMTLARPAAPAMETTRASFVVRENMGGRISPCVSGCMPP